MIRFCCFFVCCILTNISWATPVRLGLSADADPVSVAACATQGVKLVRIHADWSQLQPTAKTWSFAKLDAAVNEAINRKVDVILVLGPTPIWAITYLTNPTPEQARRAKPDLPAYITYITTLAKRYKDKVTYYQLWDRPSATTLLATHRFVQKMYCTGAQALHSVNPKLQAIAAEPGNVNIGWIDEYLSQAKGSAWPDVLLLNPTTFALAPETFNWRMQSLRTMVLPTKNAPALWADLPLGGQDSDPKSVIAATFLLDIPTLLFHPMQEDAHLIADKDAEKTLHLLNRVQGAEYVGYTTSDDGVDIPLFRNDIVTTALLVTSKPVVLPLKTYANTLAEVELIPLDGDVKKVKVQDDTTLDVNTPLALLIGVTPVPIGKSPCYTPPKLNGDTAGFDPTGKDPLAINPLPNLPGGKYTVTQNDNKTVLTTIRNEQPWIHLNIPDGFLFYNKAGFPVEVTVKVYGMREAQKSGFSFYYDAIGGMSHSPWQWIDEGTDKLYTYTMRIDDGLFANREGYDIRIEMGGSKENIRLVDVSVKKIAK